MPRLILITLAIAILGIYLFEWYRRYYQRTKGINQPQQKVKSKTLKWDPQQMGIQVYETADPKEAESLKARLEEHNIRVVLFEQAKKDLRGNEPPGIGLVVRKADGKQAQNLVCRYLETN